MESSVRASLTLAVVVFGLSLAPLASAQQVDSAKDQKAEAAFQEGRTLLGQGKLAEACAKLAESEQIVPTGRAALNLADCFERRGMVASAYAKFLDAALRAVEAHRADAERHARDRAARLEARLPRVAFVVPKEAERSGLEVRHDGRALPSSAWNTPEPVDPGTVHTFEASAAGRTFRQSVTAEEGKTVRVVLRWDEPTSAAAAPPPAATFTATSTPTITEDTKGGPSRAPAYAALGVGAVGIAVGAFSGLQVLSAKDKIGSECDAEKRCSQEGLDAASRGQTFNVVAPVAFGVGVAGLALGSWLLLRRQDKPTTASFTVLPTATLGSGSVVARGTF